MAINLPTLPKRYGFNDLAGYEEARRTQFASDIQKQLAERRAKLAEALNQQGQQLFNFANPGILEDLNSRGLLSSPTGVNQAQTDALKQIGLANQQNLNEFDNQATAAGLQAQQDTLDTGLDLRRSQLEAQLQNQQAAREDALARDLAQQQGRNQLTGSLIGLGGNLGSAFLTSKLLGGASGTTAGGLTGGLGGGGGGLLGAGWGGGGATGGPSMLGAGWGGAGAGSGFFGSAGAIPGLAALGGAGLGASLLSRAGENAYGTPGGIVANPIGFQLNKAKNVVSSVGNSIDHALFCFEPSTLIKMEDGSERQIQDVKLGDKTKGGIVESIRASITPEGTLFERKGIVVTGSHAVKEEGQWIRVEDSNYSSYVEGSSIVLSLVTSEHRIYIGDDIFADEHETNSYEHLNLDESLNQMNHDDGLVDGLVVGGNHAI